MRRRLKKRIARYVAAERRVSSRILLYKLAAFAVIGVLAFAVPGQNQTRTDSAASMRLGLRLFKDARFSSPQGDLQNSCNSCHLLDEDPQGMRVHTDFFARSWVPFRATDPRREELRNSPTILDAGLMPRLHFDGEFSSLEELVKGTLAGRPMGWLSGEQDKAVEHVSTVILKDTGEGAKTDGSYADQFKNAYGANIATLRRNEVIDLAAKALSDYIRTQKTARTTPYDRFIQVNGLDAGPARGEDAKLFASRLLDKLVALEQKRALKMTTGFDAAALKGMKLFLASDGTGSAGNCVICHTPPLFTDLSFHNMGISQSEYDQVNGDGSFSELEIPGDGAAHRPSAQFRETPSKRKPGCADLGHWNFVDLKSSPLRRAGESDDRFLQRMIATFKTPTLRNLAFSQPYMHTGAFSTVESAIAELARLSQMARAGHVREGDDELARVRLTDTDIIQLTVFLQTLNEDLQQRK